MAAGKLPPTLYVQPSPPTRNRRSDAPRVRFLFWTIWLDVPLGVFFGLLSSPLLAYGLLLPVAMTVLRHSFTRSAWRLAVCYLIVGTIHLLLFRSLRRRIPTFAFSLFGGTLFACLFLCVASFLGLH